MAYYIKIESPREFRRDILESSHKVVKTLQSYRDLLFIRQQKKDLLLKLKDDVKEIALLVVELDKLFPEKHLRQGEEAKHKQEEFHEKNKDLFSEDKVSVYDAVQESDSVSASPSPQSSSATDVSSADSQSLVPAESSSVNQVSDSGAGVSADVPATAPVEGTPEVQSNKFSPEKDEVVAVVNVKKKSDGSDDAVSSDVNSHDSSADKQSKDPDVLSDVSANGGAVASDKNLAKESPAFDAVNKSSTDVNSKESVSKDVPDTSAAKESSVSEADKLQSTLDDIQRRMSALK